MFLVKRFSVIFYSAVLLITSATIGKRVMFLKLFVCLSVYLLARESKKNVHHFLKKLEYVAPANEETSKVHDVYILATRV